MHSGSYDSFLTIAQNLILIGIDCSTHNNTFEFQARNISEDTPICYAVF